MRIYESGAVEILEAPLEFMVFPKNCPPEEAERIKRQYTEDNRRIYVELAKKGFK